MTRSRELIEKYEQIRKLQEKQERLARTASQQADDLDEILAVSRRVHDTAAGEDGLASSSHLMGPGTSGRPGPVDAEAAYSENLQRARMSSPEAFSRTRSQPGTATPSATAKPAAKPSRRNTAPKQKQPQTAPSRRPPASKPRKAPAPLAAWDEPTLVMSEPAPRAAALADEATQPTEHPRPTRKASAPPPREPSHPPAAPAAPPAARKPDYDALIAEFASDVEVKMGQGRENTYLRKRSEIEKRERTHTMVRPDKRR